MKKIRKRSAMVLLMTIAFFAGLIYHTVNIFIHAEEWVLKPQNQHLTAAGNLEYGGKIFDMNNIILAQSIDGERVYNDDELVRKACLHVIGDDMNSNVFNSIQEIYRAELIGYDFAFGFGMPKNLRKGKDIKLTIDSNLQKAALTALGSRKGAVVFYNYKTGAVACMVSTPTYDPQNRPNDLESNEAYEGVYLNRVLWGQYTPGSTFKLVTAAAGLENINDIEKKVIQCKGTDVIGNEAITCEFSMGNVNMKDAVCYSCNIYFGHLASELGKSKMIAQAEKMGFNSRIKFDGMESAKSIYDVSEADVNEFAWSGVGQYNTLETPINVAMISAAIANGGIPVTPYIVQSITDNDFEHSSSFGNAIMSAETAEKLSDYMDYAVENNYGKYSFSSRFDVCAKTGTAEVSEDGQDAHAWITGFCKDEDFPYAFAIVVEHGGSGYDNAIPVAAAVLSAAEETLDSGQTYR